MVESTTLKDIIKDYSYEGIGFIKIDIEGYEYFAFKGGAHFLLSPIAPDILFEFVDWAEGSIPEIQLGTAQKLLKEYGYNIYVFDKGRVLEKVNNTILKGTYMFYATKKNNI